MGFDSLQKSILETERSLLITVVFITAVKINEFVSYDISNLLVLQMELGFDEFEIILDRIILLLLRLRRILLINF
jgi:hypothetical protein